jgi:broad specificity phosphatase PhoE
MSAGERIGEGAGPAPEHAGPAAIREREARTRRHTTLTLVRHGDPDWAPGGGASVEDPGLTGYGRRQADAVAAALSKTPVDFVYASPYRRARETADPIARATGREARVVDGLAEVGVAVAGLTQEHVDRYFQEASRRPLAEHWEGWPGAETFRAFHERVTAALGGLLAEHGIRPMREHDFTVWSTPPRPLSLVIVAHGGTNSVLLTHLLDVRPVPWEWLRFESQLAAYSVAEARPLGERGSVWSLQNFNEVDHLRAAGLR